jgi:hypothetical protein
LDVLPSVFVLDMSFEQRCVSKGKTTSAKGTQDQIVSFVSGRDDGLAMDKDGTQSRVMVTFVAMQGRSILAGELADIAVRHFR